MDRIYRRFNQTVKSSVVAQKSLEDDLQDLVSRAIDEKLFLKNRHSGEIISAKTFKQQVSSGQIVQGSAHWRLIDAQGRGVI